MANEISIEISDITSTSAKVFITSQTVTSDTFASIRICIASNSEMITDEPYSVDLSSGESLEWAMEVSGLEPGTEYYILCDIGSWTSGEIYFETKSEFGISVSDETTTSAVIDVYLASNGNLEDMADMIVYETALGAVDGRVFYDSISPDPVAIEILLWRDTVKGLKQNTEYTVLVDYNGAVFEETFKTLSSGEIGSSGCKVTITKITENSAHFNVTKGNVSKIIFKIYLKEDPKIEWQTETVEWAGITNNDKTFYFSPLISDMEYILKAPDLDDEWELEFTTEKISGYFLKEDKDSTTSSSVRIVASSDIKIQDYDIHEWAIREVGTKNWFGHSDSYSRAHNFYELKPKTKYLVELYLYNETYFGTVTEHIVGIYVTTLPPNEFLWTYAGLDKDGKPVMCNEEGKKGIGSEGDKVENFFITVSEWNDFVEKLCETKDKQGTADESFVETELPKLQVVDYAPFTASLYSTVLGILWSMDGIGEDLLNRDWVDVAITPSHLNSIKDRLNALM